MVNKITWQRAGGVTEPGRYMFTFGWLTVTAGRSRDLEAISGTRSFTLVELPSIPRASRRRGISSRRVRAACRPSRPARRALDRLTPRPADRPPTASRRARGGRRAARDERRIDLALAGSRRRPWPVEAARLDRLHLKSVRLAPQRQRALAPQPLADRSPSPRNPPAAAVPSPPAPRARNRPPAHRRAAPARPDRRRRAAPRSRHRRRTRRRRARHRPRCARRRPPPAIP